MNNFRNSLILIAVVLVSVCVLGATSAQAALIDFEDVAEAGNQLAVGQNYVEEGFNFYNPGIPEQAVIVGFPTQGQNMTGSSYYTWEFSPDNNPIRLTNILGLAFDFESLDVGSKMTEPSIFHITGYYSGGGKIKKQVVRESAFTNLTLGLGWTDLMYVEFNHISLDYGAIDNLILTPVPASTPVPEPATMLLLGAGLIGLAGFGRKKILKK